MTVLVVDDHPVTREGVRVGLARAGHTVLEAGDLTAARQAVHAHRPAVVLLDLHLAGADGVDLVGELREHSPDTRILVLSQAPLTEVLRAIRAGAHGYVPKSAPSAELAAAVTAVRAGPVFPAELAAAIVAEADRPRLTARELDVLRCLAKSYDNREIAEELGIALRTVHRHLDAVRDKLGTRRRSQLIRLAGQWLQGQRG
ncbi:MULTISPECIES: response regulator transcription factor [unclassified Crossiella]|uniref:response regulator transcription factor n=1 Tax=unclassified Crossiella TaxID=2620835 RepID=UPI001FFE7682|nr:MULTISPECIES: response regulator transcription factor [unclassified Crossiella]MCK2241580.1 response regulator transcription factor [Crossiella sp. S99.2]MCK2255548.1 response regulator transcription factor [Crossiella sp. S99.1]